MTPDSSIGVSELLALRSLDLVEPREIIRWAADRVAAGDGGSALTALAALPDGSAEVDERLRAYAADRGLVALPESRAGVLAARVVARSLARSEVEEIDAARQIWRIAVLAPSAEPFLRTFIGLASEWDDDVENRGQYEEEIRSAALQLLVGSA